MFKPIINITLLLLLAFTQVHGSDSRLIRMATTTSTDNSGLLSEILPAYTRESGYKVHVIAVGTGKALRLGRDGDVDVVLVHAPNAENEFVRSGFGLLRHSVMYNDFVVVGPQSDPAGVASPGDIKNVFSNISRGESMFISRGDNSGTHKKERSIWHEVGIQPQGEWYREVGQGMGKVLQMANELNAYTLTDRGTWIAYEDRVELKIVFEGDSSLHNPYGIIAVNPQRYPDINIDGANSLINWITHVDKGQKLIGDFRLRGKQLFTPMAK